MRLKGFATLVRHEVGTSNSLKRAPHRPAVSAPPLRIDSVLSLEIRLHETFQDADETDAEELDFGEYLVAVIT